MVSFLQKFVHLDYKVHLCLALVLRLILIAYGFYHDQISSVPYTDIDYKVFTDAARHVLNNRSPYERHTYRYSPLIALLLIPNISVHKSFGKILFCIIDVIDAFFIRLIVKSSLIFFQNTSKTVHMANLPSVVGSSRKKSKPSRGNNSGHKQLDDTLTFTTNLSMIIWLYNPLTVAISTRGNCDSIAVFFVLSTLYFLQCKKMYFVGGLLHGIAIHFRLYPLIYSLAYFMHLSKFSFYSYQDRRTHPHCSTVSCNQNKQDKPEKSIFQSKYFLYFIPNSDQILLILGCALSLLTLTGLFFCMYDLKFLQETYLYHFVRKDPKHNFSLYFYLQYLTAWIKNYGVWQKVLIVLPQIVLMLVFSVRYGLNKYSLNFCVLTQTIVMVVYNSVLTSQYFVWIWAILPLCLWQIQISNGSALFLLVVWFVAQGAWLLPAYFLEFHGHNTFLLLWIQGISFFCANIAILGRLIMYFVPPKEKNI